MIIAPITIGKFRLVDVQELSERLQREVTLSIRDGLNLFPEEFKCEVLSTDPDGDFPIIRFGVFVDDVLVGSVWFGCNATLRGHTSSTNTPKRMIIAPITIGKFRLVDVQELSERLQREVTLSIRDGLNLFPEEFKCEVLSTDPDGDFPIIRFGVFVDDVLVGSVWFGCNATLRGHTGRNARISTRPLVGPVFRQESVFFKTDVFITMIKFFLNNVLPTREGGAIEVAQFEYVDDVNAVTEGLSSFHGEFLSGLDVSADCTVERKSRTRGGFNVQVQKRVTTGRVR